MIVFQNLLLLALNLLSDFKAKDEQYACMPCILQTEFTETNIQTKRHAALASVSDGGAFPSNSESMEKLMHGNNIQKCTKHYFYMSN